MQIHIFIYIYINTDKEIKSKKKFDTLTNYYNNLP